MPRPNLYSAEWADEFCAQIAEGKSMVTICKDPKMPCRRAIFYWLRKNPEFFQQYKIAKEECADYLVEEILEIADNGSNDWIEQNDSENLAYRVNGEHIQRSRLRVDTRKWIAGKLMPGRYGDRISTEISGGLRLEHKNITDVTDDELLEVIKSGSGAGTS